MVWILPLLAFIAALETDAFAIDAIIDVNAGYDSNVKATPDETGSSFTAYHLNFAHHMSHKKAFGKSSIYVDAYYKHYSQIGNNLSMNAGASYSCFPGNDRLMALGLLEAGIYRDHEDALDELNWIKTGGRLRYFYNGWLTFQFSPFFSWNRYLEPVEHIIENTSNRGTGETDNDVDLTSEDRKDMYMSSDFSVTAQLHPKLSMTVSALYNRLISSIEMETYDGIGGSVFLRLSPDASWGISAEASIWNNDFDTSADRSDIFRSAGLTMNYFIDRYELFIRADVMDNDSSLEYETYSRLVTQCGVAIYF